MNIIKKIWCDPACRSTIVALLLFLILPVIYAIFGCEDSDTFSAAYIKAINYKVELELWQILLALIAFGWIVTYFIRLDKNAKVEGTVIRHKSPYITFTTGGQSQRYCANCWNKNRIKIQLPEFYDGTFECPECKTQGCYD